MKLSERLNSVFKFSKIPLIDLVADRMLPLLSDTGLTPRGNTIWISLIASSMEGDPYMEL